MSQLALAQYEGLVYRAHHPGWAFDPASGEGAARHGGRFNGKGQPALYTSMDPTTAWMEAQQSFPFKPQPMTLVAYDVHCGKVADLSVPSVLAATGISQADLGCPWEHIADRGGTPPTWELADRLIADGVHAIIVPSYAPGAVRQALNMVFWRWGGDGEEACRVQAIDDLRRLPRDRFSWRGRLDAG